MTKEEAHLRFNQRMDDTSVYLYWEQRYAHIKKYEPCIAETYKTFIAGGMNPPQFYEQAVNDILATHRPLGKLL